MEKKRKNKTPKKKRKKDTPQKKEREKKKRLFADLLHCHSVSAAKIL